MSLTQTLEDVQSQVLDAVKSAQDRVVELVDEYVPAFPFADQLPKAGELADNSFTFAQKLVASQQDFVSRLVKALADTPPATPAAAKPKAAA